MGLSDRARKELAKPQYGTGVTMTATAGPDAVVCDLTEVVMTPAGDRVRTVGNLVALLTSTILRAADIGATAVCQPYSPPTVPNAPRLQPRSQRRNLRQERHKKCIYIHQRIHPHPPLKKHTPKTDASNRTQPADGAWSRSSTPEKTSPTRKASRTNGATRTRTAWPTMSSSAKRTTRCCRATSRRVSPSKRVAASPR